VVINMSMRVIVVSCPPQRAVVARAVLVLEFREISMCARTARLLEIVPRPLARGAAPRQTERVATPPLENRAGLDADRLREIQSVIADHGNLDRAVRWGLGADPRRVVSDVVVQDEYTHDVVMPWGDGLFLVYDCT